MKRPDTEHDGSLYGHLYGMLRRRSWWLEWVFLRPTCEGCGKRLTLSEVGWDPYACCEACWNAWREGKMEMPGCGLWKRKGGE
jgi:hypothetical protein